MDVINLGAGDGLAALDWTTVTGKLDTDANPPSDAVNANTIWLTTINPDGSPHVTAVGAIWVDGAFWFQTGDETRKGRNVARDPRCVLAKSVEGADVVIEGTATRVSDPDVLRRLTEAWAAGGWPVEPDASGTAITAPFNAPAQGPPPWHAYRVDARSATVVACVEPGGLTRFVF